MELRKININDKIYSVIKQSEYEEGLRLGRDFSTSALEFDGIVYPIVNNPNVPGVFNKPESPFLYYNKPSEDELPEYSSEKIFDFNPKNMREVISQSKMLHDLENEVLTSEEDNIFIPKIYPSDEPELIAMKKAIIYKKIDFDKYESRIGSTFNNDKRIFTAKSKNVGDDMSNRKGITLSKIKSLSNALDIKATLILEDKSSTVANPMNQKIVIELTGGDDE